MGHQTSNHLGYPKGGVLSPFLWNLLVDCLIRLSFNFPVRFIGYADDITIGTSHKDPVIAAPILKSSVTRFLNGWRRKLFLNPLKTIFILFSRKLSGWPSLQILKNDVVIHPSQSVTFLGFIVNANLKWKEHVKAKCLFRRNPVLSRFIGICQRLLFNSCCLHLSLSVVYLLHVSVLCQSFRSLKLP